MIDVCAGPWALVLELQRAVALPTVGPRSFGYDEALEVVLDGIDGGKVCSNGRAANLCANRAGKDRHRRRLVRRTAAAVATGDCIADTIHVRRAIDFVRDTLGAAEFALVVEVTETSYREVATTKGMPVGTLKARVSRAKAKVRAAWTERFGMTRDSDAA